jgi:PAS domain S-box-containing protein
VESAFYFPPEYLRASLLVSLLSVWLLVGLFAYLNHYTKRRYFTIWTAAWLFYAVWLTLNFCPEPQSLRLVLEMARQWCMGVSAVFVFWGSLVFMGHRVRHRTVALFVVFLLAWSCVGTCLLEKPIHTKLPVALLLGFASLRAAHCFFRYRCKFRYVGASLLSLGLLLWGIYLTAYPFWETSTQLRATSFFLSGVIQLLIAVSMIILVLEESRAVMQRLLQVSRSNREVRVGLQQQVRSSEDRYHKLFEQASDGIIITDTENLKIMEMNQRAKRLLMVTRFEPGRHSLSSFLENQAIEETGRGPAQFERIRTQRTLHVVAADGTRTPVETEATAIMFEGLPAYQFAFRELTERVRLEQQFRQSEKLAALGQMISGIAHELNNPLAVIKGYLDLVLSRHELSEQTRHDLQKVAHESSRAARLVRNFLSFARSQPAHRAATSLNQLVERMVELRRPELISAGLELRLDLKPELPDIHLDPDQIQQVVVNLLNNAVQALAGRPEPAPAGVIHVVTDRVGDTVRLCVEDNGPGVPKHLESKIFEPFFSTKEVGKGTGLGLSIAHGIMAEHNGRISCQPSPLGGACFMLELPAGESQPSETPIPPSPEPDVMLATPETPAAPSHILILDDEPVLAEMLGEILGHAGHRSTLCHSPLEALRQLDHEHFDVILSDFRMPALDGRQFYQRVLQMNSALASRVIFLTGDVVNEETRKFLSSVGNPCITKPFQMRVVEATVNRVLLQHQAAAPAVAA